MFDNVCVGKAMMINGLYFLETHACECNQQIVARDNIALKEKCSQDNQINSK